MSLDRDLFGFGHKTSLRIISIKCLRWPSNGVDARIRRSPISSWTIGRGMLRQLLSGAKAVRVMEKAVEGPGQNGIARRLVGPRRTKRDFRMAPWQMARCEYMQKQRKVF